MSKDDSWTRRNAIKTATTAALGGSALSVSVSAGDDVTTTEEAGVSERYQLLLDECRFEEARQLLERSGVNYTRQKYTDPVAEPESNEVSAEDYFDKSKSEAVFETAPVQGDEYFLTLQWEHFYQYTPSFDVPGPRDIAAVRYTPQAFIYSDDSLKHSGKLIVDYYEGGKLEINNVTSVNKEQQGQGGAYGSSIYFDDRFLPDKSGSLTAKGYMQIRVEKTADTDAPVGGSYSHAWSAFGVGGELFHGVDIGTGSITFDTNLAVDSWRLPGRDERDQDL